MGFLISAYVETRRRQLGLSLPELARRCGWRDEQSFIELYEKWLARGMENFLLLTLLEKPLGLNPRALERLARKDAQRTRDGEAVEEKDRPFEPRMIVRYMPAVYGEVPFPADLHGNMDAMVRYARDWFREHGGRFRVLCLRPRPRVTVYLAKDGSVEKVDLAASEEEAREREPRMSIEGLPGSARIRVGGDQEDC